MKYCEHGHGSRLECGICKMEDWCTEMHQAPEVPQKSPLQQFLDNETVASTSNGHYGARKSDPDTSHDAYARANHNATMSAIIGAANEHGMGTEEEYAIWTGIERTSLSPQFRPMIRMGLMVDIIDPRNGKKMKRRNPTSGVRALVRGLPHHQEDVNERYR